jgi:vesicle coat complex subunit
VVKLFLKRPDKAQGLVQKVLQAATAENDNPDIRDRAYVYWRLLSNTSDPNAAKNIVLSEKPPIVTTIQSLPPSLLDKLLTELSTLASVYHEPPEQFVGQGRFGADAVQKAAIEYVCHFISLHSLSFHIQLLTYCQGTTAKCSREPIGCGCGGRCRYRWRTTSANTK